MEENNLLEPRATPELKDLNDPERRAVELKYLGKPYAAIAATTGYHEGSIKKLFMTDGRLTKAYEEFASIQRGKSQENVDLALSKAKAETVNAMERIIALSKDAQTEGGIFKANEFLLQVAGVKETDTLRTFLQSKTHEQASRIMDDLFRSIYGRGLAIFTMMPAIQRMMPDGTWEEAKYNIGSQTKEEEKNESNRE